VRDAKIFSRDIVKGEKLKYTTILGQFLQPFGTFTHIRFIRVWVIAFACFQFFQPFNIQSYVRMRQRNTGPIISIITNRLRVFVTFLETKSCDWTNPFLSQHGRK
jgi:hypothetical protein